jgi:hypothetical protein
MSRQAPLAARCPGDGRASFLVPAPFADSVGAHIVAPDSRTVRLERGPYGYHYGEADGLAPGARCFLRLASGAGGPGPAYGGPAALSATAPALAGSGDG